MTLPHVHRHAAVSVLDLASCEERLQKHGVRILFGESCRDPDDALTQNMIAGWRVMYGGIPLFCEDPFGNLLEFVPLNRSA